MQRSHFRLAGLHDLGFGDLAIRAGRTYGADLTSVQQLTGGCVFVAGAVLNMLNTLNSTLLRLFGEQASSRRLPLIRENGYASFRKHPRVNSGEHALGTIFRARR